MADDTITVNMMPSCGQCKKQSDYAGYKKYTKTWKNLCTSTTCNSKTPGTLQNNPKGTYEGELTCSKCDSDYCGFCGTEKSGSARFRLVSADASSNTDDKSDDTGSSASNYDDMIKDLLKPLDGEVEYRIEDNKVYVNKIPSPDASTELWIREGVNITNDGVTVHDYNPDTPNFFVFSYGEKYDKKFVIKIPTLIDRFGPKVKEINCTKKVLEWTQDTSSSSTDSTGTSTDGSSTSNDSSSTSATDSTSSSGGSTTKTSSKNTSKHKSTRNNTKKGYKKITLSGSGVSAGTIQKNKNKKNDDWGKNLISWLARKIRGK